MTALSLVSAQHAFIAYRRECGHAALALARSLRRGGREVFRDIEGLRGSDLWANTVRAAIEKAGAMIVLIDRSWNSAASGKRDPRLWTEHDPLRVEIRHAITHGIPLVAVLIDDAPMPLSAELPQDIRALCERQAVRLRHTEFETDVQRIASELEQATNDREAISAVIARLGAEPEQVALPLASGASAAPPTLARSTMARASQVGFPFERGSVLERLSAFKPSALLESLSHAKADDLRSILTGLTRTSTQTAAGHAEPLAASEDQLLTLHSSMVTADPASDREKA